MSFKLYELTEIYNNVMHLMEDEDADLEALDKALADITDGIYEKAENIAKLVKSFEGNIEVIRAEEKRLENKRRVLNSKIDNIKKYLEFQLVISGIEKVDGDLFTVALQNNPQKVNFINEDLIPNKYKEEIITIKIPKKKILEDIKKGIEVAGVEVVQEKSLRIK